jgi:hypothetical protein
MEAFTKLLAGAALTLGSIVALSAVAQPDERPDQRARPSAAGSIYSHEDLQRAADMTQQMSATGANTASRHHLDDEQLSGSRSLAYLQALERHQSDIDRMLARPSP